MNCALESLTMPSVSLLNEQNLEYLDLSASDDDGPVASPSDFSELHLPGAEFYSFDDFPTESLDSPTTYDHVISFPVLDANANSTQKRPLTRCGKQSHNQGKQSPVEFPLKLTKSAISRVDSGSSSSTNATSSSRDSRQRDSRQRDATLGGMHSPNLTPSHPDLSPRSSLSSVDCSNKIKLREKHSLDTILAANNPIYGLHLEPRPLAPSNKIYSEVLLADPVQNSSMKNQETNQERTEALISGITRLASEDVLKADTPVAPPRPNHRRKHLLHTSVSSPQLLTSKESSPRNPPKRVTFVRGGSMSSQNSIENEDVKKSKKTKSFDKLSSIANDIAALFEAVEHFDIDKVSQLLSADNASINCPNADGLTVLDIAILTNHVPMTKTLLKLGAQPKLLEEIADRALCTRLQRLIIDAEQHVLSLSQRTSVGSGPQLKDNEKKLNQWEFKHRLFRRMKNGYEQAGLPGQPKNVKLSVTSDSSLMVRFDSPDLHNGAVVTRYKVEWSRAQNFRPLAGEMFINDMQNLQLDINGLDKGIPYYVRVLAWNMKGFGRCAASDPPYAMPSSWRDVESFESRSSGYNTHIVNDISHKIKKYRSHIEMESSGASPINESPTTQRKNPPAVVKRGLKSLFSSSGKFQKSIKRGVYLSCVFYNEDRILVTTEDNLPIVEVDESLSAASIQTDFDWLMKVSSPLWDMARQLKQDLEKLNNLSSVHLRQQLLNAVLQLQNMLGVQDLGRLFYKPVKDASGSIVFVLINNIEDPKIIGNAAVKWQTRAKLMKNIQPSDCLLPLLSEMIFYHRKSQVTIPPGLYLGYLHVKINIDSIRVLAPESSPNILPYVKVRDCPNVSQPEWRGILDLSDGNRKRRDSTEIITFKKLIMKSAKKLTDKLGLAAEQVGDHRVYDVEVLEFSRDVSFILLVPPRDLVCSIHSDISNSGDSLTPPIARHADYMDMPVKSFEMIHLHTYQPDFIDIYSRTACVTDTELLIAQQLHREAFSNEEVERTKKQVETVKSYQGQLEEVWRSTRWLMDVITFARDKTSQGITLTTLYNNVMEQTSTNEKGSDDGYHSDKLSLGGSSGSDKLHSSSAVANQNVTNNNNGHYYDGEFDYHHLPAPQEKLEPGILRVYAAYNSGLTKGTSVMLHVTPRTTAREVINLVVMQLNQAVIRKGQSAPLYPEDRLLDFCLVAVIGPRERVLRDDYHLLELQNPWTKGRLYVRMKTNLLAALEHGETTDV